MGVYIKGMEMPRKGQMLVIFPDGTSYVCFNGMRERLAQTEAVPVPPHGRLIDADAFLALINDSTILPDFLKCIINPLIRGEQTVIEAEEGET